MANFSEACLLQLQNGHECLKFVDIQEVRFRFYYDNVLYDEVPVPVAA